MSRLLWFVGWVGTALWSLLAFTAYGLVDAVGTSAMRNADVFSADPETVEWLFGLFSWGRGLSVSVILVVWGVVTLAILSVPWLFDRLTAPPRAGRAQAPATPGGVIDLAPGEWSVRDRDIGRPTTVPQVRRPGFGS